MPRAKSPHRALSSTALIRRRYMNDKERQDGSRLNSNKTRYKSKSVLQRLDGDDDEDAALSTTKCTTSEITNTECQEQANDKILQQRREYDSRPYPESPIRRRGSPRNVVGRGLHQRSASPSPLRSKAKDGAPTSLTINPSSSSSQRRFLFRRNNKNLNSEDDWAPVENRRKSRVSHAADARDPAMTKKAEGLDLIEQEREECVAPRPTVTVDECMQRQVVYHNFGKADELVIEELDRVPAPNELDHVIVRVEACTVTIRDVLLRRGFCFDVLNPVSLPVTPGEDVVGTVLACGTKVMGYHGGERVAALMRTGGNARYVSVPEQDLVPVPKQLDPADAVAMVSVFTTAYQALRQVVLRSNEVRQKAFDRRRNQEHTMNFDGLTDDGAPMFSLEDRKVMIIGGLDGVGQALVQMCEKARAEKVYIVVPPSKLEYVRKTLEDVTPLPADEVDSWLPKLKGKIDFVFDGSSANGWQVARDVLKPNVGQLLCFGYSSMMQESGMGIFGAPLSSHLNRLWSKSQSNIIDFDIYESFVKDPIGFKKNLASHFQLLKWEKVDPQIAKRITLDEVSKAHMLLEKGEAQGLIVCLPFKTDVKAAPVHRFFRFRKCKKQPNGEDNCRGASAGEAEQGKRKH